MITHDWIDEHCLEMLGVTKDFQEEWVATRYHVGGKMFAMVAENAKGQPIITLKLEPSYGEFLRNEYEDITAGYYMNKLHWNSILLEGNITKDLIKSMLTESHQLVFKGLTKKLQKELADNAKSTT